MIINELAEQELFITKSSNFTLPILYDPYAPALNNIVNFSTLSLFVIGVHQGTGPFAGTVSSQEHPAFVHTSLKWQSAQESFEHVGGGDGDDDGCC